MRRLLSVFVLLLAGVPGWAAEIVGNDTYKRDRSVTLTAAEVKLDTGIVWEITPPEGVEPSDIEYITGPDGPTLRFVAPPGKYLVELLAIDAPPEPGKPFGISKRKKTVTIVDPVNPAPAPKPKPDPKPDPDPIPKPDPDAPADPVLVASLGTALAADLAVPKTTATKAHVAALGKIYKAYVDVLDFPDPAARPKTWGEVVDGLQNASILAQIPSLPDLEKVRKIVAAEIGALPLKTPVDVALTKTLTAKFNRVAAALQAASK